jgi:hypothetical protein
MLPPNVDRTDHIPVTLVPTLGAVKVPAVTALGMVGRRFHGFTTVIGQIISAMDEMILYNI